MVAHGDKDHRSTNPKFTEGYYRRAKRLPDSVPDDFFMWRAQR